jgi:hypothetical protein
MKKLPQLYSCSAVEKLINAYVEKGGEVTEIEEGSLGYGFLILHGKGLKTTVVKEVYLNEWSSGHTIRKYDECPKKYKKVLEEVI